MSNAIIAYTLIAIVLLLMVIVVVTLLYARNTRAKLMQSVGLIENLFSISQALKSAERSQIQQIENIGHQFESILSKNSSLSDELEALKVQVERLMDNDPEIKMYSKAAELVAKGERIEDVKEATGLPYTELEMLYSLQNRK